LLLITSDIDGLGDAGEVLLVLLVAAHEEKERCRGWKVRVLVDEE